MKFNQAAASNEKVIVSSTTYDIKKWLIRICAVVLALLLLNCVVRIIRRIPEYYQHEHDSWCYGFRNSYSDEQLSGKLNDYTEAEQEELLDKNCHMRRWYSGALDYAFNSWAVKMAFTILFAGGGGLALLSLLAYAWLHSFSISVTDKRIFGKASFGKQVELPVDSVSAVSTGAFKSIAVATSSGRISFLLIKDRDEIHEAISRLLVDRQNSQKEVPAQAAAAPASAAEELKKYKELLDIGAITQEEFDNKKKQLLDL